MGYKKETEGINGFGQNVNGGRDRVFVLRGNGILRGSGVVSANGLMVFNG